jgi:hypothetical protein
MARKWAGSGSGIRNLGIKLATVTALASVIATASLLASACAHQQAKDRPAFAQGNGENGMPPGPPPNGEGGNPPGSPPDGKGEAGSPGGQLARAPDKIAATYSVIGRSDTKGGVNFIASAKDSSAVYVGSGGTLSLSNSKLTKSGKASNNDQSSFYGVNAALLAASGAQVGLAGLQITTKGEGANAIVATGSGTRIIARGLKIRTSENGSRGLHATMQGVIEAQDVDIETKGEHCAALATDRGEGTVRVTGGQLVTSGEGSPCIYSTGSISATKIAGRATGSEAAVVEGKNSIVLVDAELYGARRCGVMLYQSFSGDAGTGTASFDMTGGSLEAATGPLVFVSNTSAKLSLKSVKAKADSGVLFKAGADRWGRRGSNGGHLTAAAEAQTLEGDILVESGSSISLELTKGSSMQGKIDGASLSLGKGCRWKVTGDSKLVAVAVPESDIATLISRIEDGGHRISYDAEVTENAWLEGKSYDLTGGGKLVASK